MIEALIGALGGIGSAGIGALSQGSANRANLRIAQMNNEWSERMMDKQASINYAQWLRESQFSEAMADKANAFTEYMFDRANEYNSAKNQAARLREAGLNPAIVMGGANAGTASAHSGAQAATPSGNGVGLPSPASATIQPIMGVADLAGLMSAVAQARKTSAEADQLEASKDVMLAQARENLRSLKFNNDFNDDVREWRVAGENEKYLQTLTSRLLTQEQAKLVKQNRIYQELINENMPEKLRQEISVMASQVELNRHNAKTEFEKMIDALKRRGYNLSKNQEKLIFDAVIGNVFHERFKDVPYGLGHIFSGISEIRNKLDW